MYYEITQLDGKRYRIYRNREQNTPQGRIEILENTILKQFANRIEKEWLWQKKWDPYKLNHEDYVKSMLDRCGSFILLGELRYGGILTTDAEKKMFDNEISLEMDDNLNVAASDQIPQNYKKSEKVKEFDRLAKKKRKNSNYLRKIVNHKYTFEYKSCPVDTENKFIFCGKRFEIDKCLGQFDPVELNNGELFYQVDQIHAYEQKGKFFFFDRELNDITGYVKEWEIE